jgi:hypothetical protein
MTVQDISVACSYAAPVIPEPRRYLSPHSVSTIEKFDGQGDPRAWFDTIRESAACYGWTSADCISVVRLRLKGPQQRWAQQHEFPDFDDLERQYLDNYGETLQTAIARLEKSEQRPGESVRAFADRFQNDAYRAGRAEDQALLYQFITRLHPHLVKEVARQQPSSIADAVKFSNYLQGFERKIPVSDIANSSPAVARPNPARQVPPPARTYGGQQPWPAPRQDSGNGNNNNRSFNRPRYSPDKNGWGPRTPPQAPMQQQANRDNRSELEELTRNMSKLTIAVNNLLQSGIPEAAYQQRYHHPLPTSARQISYLDPLTHEDLEEQGYYVPASAYAHEDSYTELMPAEKRQAEEEAGYTPYVRMPHKRTAINPHGNTPYAPTTRVQPAPAVVRPTAVYPAAQPAAGPAQMETDSTGRRLPRGRTAIAVPQSLPPAPVPEPAALRNTVQFDAAAITNDKGREMAAAVCKSMKLDAAKEGTVVPHAVLHCVAGHLLADRKLIEKGKTLAREVDLLVRRTMPGPPILAAAAATAHPIKHGITGSFRQPGAPTLMNKLHLPQAIYTKPRVSACKVIAKLADEDTEAIVDTGASTSAVSMDCLRRKGQDHLLVPEADGSYINADGRLSDGFGRVFHLPLGLGQLTTLINPTVTEALNYDLLIGNDVLNRIHANINFANRTLTFPISPTTTQELSISLDPPLHPPISINLCGDTYPSSGDATTVRNANANSAAGIGDNSNLDAATTPDAGTNNTPETAEISDKEEEDIEDNGEVHGLISSTSIPQPVRLQDQVTHLLATPDIDTIQTLQDVSTPIEPNKKKKKQQQHPGTPLLNIMPEPETPAAAPATALAAAAGEDDPGPFVDPAASCEDFGSANDWYNMLLCMNCNAAHHTSCVGLNNVPTGDWFGKEGKEREELKRINSDGNIQHQQADDTGDHPSDSGSPTSQEEEKQESKGQAKDVWEDAAVVYYLKTDSGCTKLLLEESPAALKREIKRDKCKAKGYCWETEAATLYRCPIARYAKERVVPPAADRADSMQPIHASGHLGSMKCTSMSAEHWYWRSMNKQVRRALRKYKDYMRNRAMVHLQPKMRPLTLSKLLERAHINTAGPCPATRCSENCYCLHDACSRYREVKPAPRLATQAMCGNILAAVAANTARRPTQQEVKAPHKPYQQPRSPQSSSTVDLAASSDGDIRHAPSQQQESSVCNLANNRQRSETEVAHSSARSVQAAQEQQMSDFNTRHFTVQKPSEPVGILVLTRCPASCNTGCNTAWEGPYRLLRWNSQEDVALLDDACGVSWPAHACWLGAFPTEQ